MRETAIGPALVVLALASLDRWLGAGSPELGLAYIDPGAGSFVVQAVVAVLAGAAVTLRAYWSRIRRLFGAKAEEAEGEARDADPTAGDD